MGSCYGRNFLNVSSFRMFKDGLIQRTVPSWITETIVDMFMLELKLKIAFS